MNASFFEALNDELSPFIAKGVDLCHAGMSLIDELRSEDRTVATLPESTVLRLHLVAVSTFQSGLLCLWMPETSLASYGLIRGLLEAWAHLIFISDDTQGGDARCRALRYERGSLGEWSDTVLKGRGYRDMAEWQERHGDRKRNIEQMWKDCGCTGKPRIRKHVFATLQAKATEPTMGWIPVVWSASSASTHGYGVDFLLHSRGDKTSLVWASQSQRATWFVYLAAAYGYLTMAGAEILAGADQRIDSFRDTARTLLEDEHLIQLASRDLDG